MSAPEQQAALRVIDASLNRATEGVRVVEDYTRFVLDDAHLTSLLKALRHDLSAAGAGFGLGDRLRTRDTQQDVGTENKTPDELVRTDAWHVAAANLSRLQESLRSLEEFSKTLAPALAERFEKLRYHAYTLAKAIGTTRHSRERLQRVRLYVLVGGGESLDAFRHLVSSLVGAGVDALQLRDKSLDDRALAERAKALVELARPAGVLSIINDRADLAAIAHADGVHVGQEDLGVKDARSVLGTGAVVGVSTHHIAQARQAVLDGADYLGLGPTFPTPTKTFDAFPGLDYVRQASAEVSLPTFAVGGVTPANLGKVLAAGASRVAVSSAVTAAADPALAVRTLKEAIGQDPATPVGDLGDCG